MELINHTPFPAGLNRTVIDEQRFAASVLTRVTYDLIDGRAVPSTEQPWLVSAAPWESEHGPMDSDEVFYKGGVDVFIFGCARPPRGIPATRLEIQVQVGAFHRRILVYGDRVWQRNGRGLVPSQPRQFTAIPLTLANAFGGKDVWDELEIPFPDNPEGKGFYLEEKSATGKPLPNIEDPDRQIGRWDERPEPVGVVPCPLSCGLRLRNGLVFNEEGALIQLRPQLFNAAFPAMIAPAVQPGDCVVLSGVAEAGDVAFSIPHTALAVRLQFDDEIIERTLSIDQVGIEVDKGRVFIAYRYPFRYVLYPLQRRSCELCLKTAPEPLSARST